MFGILTLQFHCFPQIFKELILFNNLEEHWACATGFFCSQCVISLSTIYSDNILSVRAFL